VGEPRFYAMQRRLLGSPRFGGPVFVYASRRLDRPHLVPFFSSSFTRSDWQAGGAGFDRKLARITGGEGGTAEDPWRLVAVGRLTPNKNQRVAVQALALMAADGVEAVLDVYGDGPERPRLERLAADLDVADRVRFHGSVNHGEVMEAFAHCDLQLLTTRQEGYGKVLLEGMLHGTVAVFSESPVADEIAGGGGRGLVVPADDPAAVARAVEELTSDRARWASMAKAARDYTSGMTLDEFWRLVRDVLERQWGIDLRLPASESAS
jgi:glycosyltransferase involved in cell wall biosynthesis